MALKNRRRKKRTKEKNNVTNKRNKYERIKINFFIVNGTSKTINELKGNIEYKERGKTIHKQEFAYGKELKDKGIIDVRAYMKDGATKNRLLYPFALSHFGYTEAFFINSKYEEISIFLSCKITDDAYELKSFIFRANKNLNPQLVFHKKIIHLP
jgi:hypothetical protein